MSYKNINECVLDLERNGHLIRIKEEVDPNLEMAAIHLKVFEAGGPALLFENIKGCQFKAVSNLFGTLERSHFIFRDTFEKVQSMIELKNDPIAAIKSPIKNMETGWAALKALPSKKGSISGDFVETTIDQLPLIKCWPDDGGAFITLPQVYSEDVDKPGIMGSNIGMYRIQLTGNDYELNNEIGLHYQIHRGIGVHQAKANSLGQPLKVSIFVGGPPAHTLAAVMPLPEGLSETTFAGALAGRKFSYSYHEGYCVSNDADFVIMGEIYPDKVKPEGPFGDHLGYYSLTHDFPVMKVHKVLHKKDAIWPFTVVGRPPQEDTQFGALIHELSSNAIGEEIPGLHEVNAVDAAGVHPLLLAMGSERYTPYNKLKQPQELLTIANHILGFGQLSLAKYLFIGNKGDDTNVSVNNIEQFFKHILERVNWTRDVHFQTNTTIDTLDYSSEGLNTGSKVVIAACGEPIRTLSDTLPKLNGCNGKMVMSGILAVELSPFESYEQAEQQINDLKTTLSSSDLNGIGMIVVADDVDFISAALNNFLWTTFTRSNPSHDIYGVDEFLKFKHWGCNGPLIIDARMKPHHAPELIPDKDVEKRIAPLFEKGASLENLI